MYKKNAGLVVNHSEHIGLASLTHDQKKAFAGCSASRARLRQKTPSGCCAFLIRLCVAYGTLPTVRPAHPRSRETYLPCQSSGQLSAWRRPCLLGHMWCLPPRKGAVLSWRHPHVRWLAEKGSGHLGFGRLCRPSFQTRVSSTPAFYKACRLRHKQSAP
jgi:hypothetical protein